MTVEVKNGMIGSGVGLECSPYVSLQAHARVQIENLIAEKSLSSGERLPSVSELSRAIGISRATTGKAIANMINDGFLISRPKKGIYLSDVPQKQADKPLEIIYCLIEAGTSLRDSALDYLIHNSFWSTLMAGVRNTAKDLSDIRLRVSFLEEFIAEADITPRGRDWSVVGFIVLGDPHKHLWPPLVRLNAPIVLVNGATRSRQISEVYVDVALGVEMLVDHLVLLGHERIAYCGVLEKKHRFNYRKFEGFKRAMRKHSLDIEDAYCRECYFGMEEGYNAAKYFLDLPQPPTAVISLNDETAIGAMRCFCDAGLSVPDDISVTGFDNIISSSYTIPSLTTISSRMTEMGQISVSKLLDYHKSKEPTSFLIRPELVVRESTGRVKR